jgi:choline dehydrogenase-like flavoprotein
MVFNRGSAQDYDRWESLGNPGWNFENLLPYFKKSEHFTPPNSEEQKDWGIGYVPEYHGENGNVDVSFPNFVWPSSRKCSVPSQAAR